MTGWAKLAMPGSDRKAAGTIEALIGHPIEVRIKAARAAVDTPPAILLRRLRTTTPRCLRARTSRSNKGRDPYRDREGVASSGMY